MRQRSRVSIRDKLIGLAVAAGFVGMACAQERPTSVCEIMGSLKSYAGRVVAVIGQLEAGPEQFFLSEEHCKQPFVTEGLVWPTALQLRFPGGPETPSTVPFEADGPNIRSFRQAVGQAKAKNGAARGCIIVRGMIQVPDDYSVRIQPDGKKRGHGFGHMSAFPAQLIIRSVEVRSLQPYSSDLACACCK